MDKNIFIEDHLLLITKAILDLFLKQDNPDDLIALYTFYYYTAKWQRTNQPYCTDRYIMKGLKWGEKKFRPAKNFLLEEGIIEQIANNISGKTRWFIKLNYIIGNDLAKSVSYQKRVHAFERSNALNNNILNELFHNSLGRLETPLSNKEKKKINFTPNKQEIELMDYWNKLPNVPKHQKPETNVYLKSCKMFRQLSKGKYFDHYKVSDSFKENNKIKTIALRTKYDYPEIKKHLKTASLFYQAGYWPLDKKGVPKNLPDLLFNKIRQSSWFFKAIANPPKESSDFNYSRPKNREIYKEYRRLYENFIMDAKDESALTEKVNAVLKFFEKKCQIIFKNDKFRDNYSKSALPIMKEHVKWLSKKKELYLNFLNTESQTFTNFLIYLKTLRSGQWDFLAGRKIKEDKKKSKSEYSHITDIVY